MGLMYKSTRSDGIRATASQAILQGMAPDGGLYVPERIPRLTLPLDKLADLDYRGTALAVMRQFLTDYTEEELISCINAAYDDKFDTEEFAPLHEAGSARYLELYHGATVAFKDMALSILPYLMTTAAKKNREEKEIVILTATSGDTGKAALAGFSDVPGTRIVVFYPKNGVSPIQERQMVTQKGGNCRVIGIRGNFDDAQNGVKALFADRALGEELKNAGFRFSSANSINIGRLVPQIVYYVYAYGRLVKEGALKAGEPMQVAVPTGNFGNILAAYYVKQMGLPVSRLVCASNENKVLYDFFKTGVYDRNRDFVLTSSPSMDILISSNLERLIYHSTGDDPEKTAALMRSLNENGRYEVSAAMREKMADFAAGYATEEQTAEEIRRVFETYHYVIDTHTAVASSVFHREFDNEDLPTVIVSTASPYKFSRSVLSAIGADCADTDDFDLADQLEHISGMPIPRAIREIKSAPVRHDLVIEKDRMKEAVRAFLGLG